MAGVVAPAAATAAAMLYPIELGSFLFKLNNIEL